MENSQWEDVEEGAVGGLGRGTPTSPHTRTSNSRNRYGHHYTSIFTVIRNKSRGLFVVALKGSRFIKVSTGMCFFFLFGRTTLYEIIISDFLMK